MDLTRQHKLFMTESYFRNGNEENNYYTQLYAGVLTRPLSIKATLYVFRSSIVAPFLFIC
jgi:hypothetical protein